MSRAESIGSDARIHQMREGAAKTTSALSSLRVTVIPNALADGVVRQHHYLHRARVGQRFSYGIYDGAQLEGVIVYARPFTRFVNGHPSNEGVEFARLFLFHNIPNCASWAIARTIRCIGQDWQLAYGDRPKWVASWSDNVVHSGTIYKAAGFLCVGITKPRKRGKRYPRKKDNSYSGDRPMRNDHWNPKTLWFMTLKGETK